MTPFTALVLAGSRGEPDALSVYAGVSHKGLIPLGRQTLLERVIRALDAAGASHIGVSTSDAGVITALGSLKTKAHLEALPASASPSLSVGQGARAALERNFHRAAGRILCRRLKYATGYCKWQSGLAATIH